MIALALFSLAQAADPGDVVHTEIRTDGGWINPAVLVGFNPQPEPPGDFQLDKYTAVTTVPYEEREDFGVVIGVAEEKQGVEALWLDGKEPVLVYGKGAEERWLPPGPCFDLRAAFGDGTEMIVHVAITSADGWIDPGSLVGFNPQPEPPGDFPAAIQLDLSAMARGAAKLQVEISLESGGEALPLY